jgi:hypothetical protein
LQNYRTTDRSQRDLVFVVVVLIEVVGLTLSLGGYSDALTNFNADDVAVVVFLESP